MRFFIFIILPQQVKIIGRVHTTQGAHGTSQFKEVENSHVPMYWCALPDFQTFRLPCYKFERIYLPTFPRPSGKCSTTHPCKILLGTFFLKQSYASISFPLCSCFSKLQQVSKVQNIWFLSPLVLSKRENLALLSLYTFWGKCVYFSIFEW